MIASKAHAGNMTPCMIDVYGVECKVVLLYLMQSKMLSTAALYHLCTGLSLEDRSKCNDSHGSTAHTVCQTLHLTRGAPHVRFQYPIGNLSAGPMRPVYRLAMAEPFKQGQRCLLSKPSQSNRPRASACVQLRTLAAFESSRPKLGSIWHPKPFCPCLALRSFPLSHLSDSS